jgi:hypothetical protein
MFAFSIKKILTSATGVLLIGIAVGSTDAAFAQSVSLGSILPTSANSLLAQSSPTSPNKDLRPIISKKTSGTISAAKIPEPATLAGLGVVASSFVLTRRRQGKKEL